jgi:lipopolysaccharide export system permease protein
MILQRYVFRELLTAFLMVFLALFSVIVITLTLMQMHRVTAEAGIGLALELLPYLFPGVMSYTIPMALLVACIFVFGRLSADNEIMCIKTSGVNLARIMPPVFLLGLVLTLLIGYFSIYLIPQCYAKARAVSVSTLKSRLLSPNLASHSLKLPDHRINFVDFKDGVFKQLIVAGIDDQGCFQQELHAEEGRFSLDEDNAILQLELKNIIETQWDDPTQDKTKSKHKKKGEGGIRVPRMMKSEEMIQRTDLSRFFIIAPKKNLASMSQPELDNMIRNNDTKRFKLYELQTEKYKRLAMSIAPFLFILIGMPLGIIIRKGSKLLGIGASCLIIFVGYYPLVVLGNLLGSKDKLPPQIAVWIAPLVCVIIGGLLIHQVLKR